MSPTAFAESIQDVPRSRMATEFSRLLDLAESLRGECDRHRRERSRLLTLYGSAWITLGIISHLTRSHSDPITFAMFAGLLIYAGWAYVSPRWSLLRSRIRCDANAVDEIVTSLREIRPFLDRQDGLDPLELLGWKVRLARFPIGADDLMR